MYTDKNAVAEALLKLGPSYQVLNADIPERGLLGYVAYLPPPSVVSHDLYWPLFGRELRPDVEVLDGPGLVEFIRNEPSQMLASCDSPKSLLWGFVSYRREAEGLATVRQVRMRDLRQLPSDAQEFLNAMHISRFSSGAWVWPDTAPTPAV